jgi:RNA polymerase sigma factor (sigma-70 family)
MIERHECEALLLEQLVWIRRTMVALCRRNGMDDAEEFVSWGMLRLVEDDYAVLRRFRGESSVRTYLTVVLTMLHRDYRVHRWGRWRPSAASRRLGSDAMRLEMLVHRDGLPLREAILHLRGRGETTRSERELTALFAALPRRAARRREETLGDLDAGLAAPSRADELVAEGEAVAHRRAVHDTLERAIEGLGAEERTVVWLRYWEGLSIADIARRLGVPQRPLYNRLARVLGMLRRRLESEGVSCEGTRALLEGAT